MRQRSIRRTTEPSLPQPKRDFQKYKPKPSSFGQKRFFRDYCKKFYKAKKKEDSALGILINELVQELHYEKKQLKINPPETKEKAKEVEEYITETVRKILELRQVGRIKNDLSSFAAFFRYVRKQKISYDDLKEMEKDKR